MKRFLCGLGSLVLLPAVHSTPVVGGVMYGADNVIGDIRRANLDGSGSITLVRGISSPLPPTLDLVHGQMYWSEGAFTTGASGQGRIVRANLDGSGRAPVVTSLKE